MNPRASPGPKFRRRAAGYYTLRFAGLFDYHPDKYRDTSF
jgi:hypothetical protein